MASSAATTAGTITLDTTPLQITPRRPTAAIVAPTMPPISACEELDGMPSNQVNRFQTIPPTRPANTNSSVTRFASIRPLAIVAATAVDKKRTDQVQHGRKCYRYPRCQGAAGNRGRHGVSGVVEPVGEVERQCRHDDNEQKEQLKVHRA